MAVTWNPADCHPTITLSGGNLIASGGSLNTNVRATAGKSAGKWYFEVTMGGTPSGDNTAFGIGTGTAALDSWIGGDGASAALYQESGDAFFYYNASGDQPGSFHYDTGYTIACAYDIGAGFIWFRIWNGSSWGAWNGSHNGNPATGAGALTFGFATAYPIVSPSASGCSFTANFGATAFLGTVPAGFSGLDTAAGTAQHLAANAADVSTSTAALSLSKDLSAAANALASAAASVRVRRDLAAAISGVATVNATLEVYKNLGLTAAAAVTSAGALELKKHLATAAAAVASASAALGAQQRHLAAAAQANATSAAALDVQHHLAAAAQAAATATATLDAQKHLAAAAQAAAAATAALEVVAEGQKHLAAAATAIAAASATIELIHHLAATAGAHADGAADLFVHTPAGVHLGADAGAESTLTADLQTRRKTVPSVQSQTIYVVPNGAPQRETEYDFGGGHAFSGYSNRRGPYH